jgi:DNA repair protein RecN (Recombination protein N)
MLTRIEVNNLAVIEKIDCSFHNGLTVFTGETGAGKSLLIDALSLICGSRADSSMVREGADTADVTAEFSTSDHADTEKILAAQGWDDNELHVLSIRKVISRIGPAKTFINGHSATLQDLRKIVSPLINIHGQGSHEKLRNIDLQHELYDRYLGIDKDVAQLASTQRKWQSIENKINTLSASSQSNRREIEFLIFQLKEFEGLNLDREYLEELEGRHRRLSHILEIQGHTDEALRLISHPDENAIDTLLQQLRNELSHITNYDERFKDRLTTLEGIQIDIQEIESELNAYSNSEDISPEEIQRIEKEIEKIFDLTRKHRCEMYDLITEKNTLNEKLAALEGDEFSIDDLLKERDIKRNQFLLLAKKISKQRHHSKEGFEAMVKGELLKLGFKSFEFKLNFKIFPDGAETYQGLEQVQFYICPNPGQPLAPLDLIASGGEMSRICLALELIGLEVSEPTTIIFDEVDAGIGGAIAEIVGTSLKKLSDRHQVLCITHLPQVAYQGHQHLRIMKAQGKASTKTSVELLSKETRVEELSRMLGGVNITDATRAHAKELLG